MNQALPALRFFLPDQDIARLEPFGQGNVNDTFLVTLQRGRQLVLQRVNPAVFPDPQLVQHNIRLVTAHLDRQVRNSPELKGRFTPLILCRGKKGDAYQDQGGAVWRLVNRVPGRTCETVSIPCQARELGRCLGVFHHLLSSLDPDALADVLPDFHSTPACLERYDRARAACTENNKPDIEKCCRFIENRRSVAFLLNDAPELCRRIIHGDPKVANFDFDRDMENVVSLIDLDTVRPGLLLHDIGDALRSCCNPLGESSRAPEGIHFDPELFDAWLSGYAAEAELLLTNMDIAHIVESVRVIAFELGLRFVTDHLEGDHYFKTRFRGHNLIRAQVQFRLVRSIEDQFKNLQHIVTTRINR